MRIGPFSSFHIGQLEELLQQKNIEYSIFQDPEAVEKIRKLEVERTPTRLPLYRSTGDYIYVDLAAADAMSLRAELEKFGIVFIDEQMAHDLHAEEFYCLSCDYTADSPGFCRQHQTQLVNFTVWAAKTSKSSSKNELVFTVATVLAFLALALWYFRAQ